jgi:hypothetical protein
MNFKMLLSLLSCSLALCNCSFTNNMHAASNLERIAHPRYQYIHDYNSRVRQVQMLNHKREIKEANTFSYVLTDDETLIEEKDFKHIKLKNKSTRTLFAEIIAEVTVYELNPVDPADTMNIVNVKKIRIPPGESLKIILPLNQPYKLHYGLSNDEEKNLTHNFTPASSRKRFIIGESRIKGSR